jgi:hypothetical protein
MTDQLLFGFSLLQHPKFEITADDLIRAIDAGRPDLIRSAWEFPGLCPLSVWKQPNVVNAFLAGSPAIEQLYLELTIKNM